VLAAEFGTPVFVYDLRTIDRQVQAARARFEPRRFEIAFSVKANPSLAIVDHMRSLGLGLCVCSAGELDIARQLGFAGSDVTLVGPAKSSAELTDAAAYGVAVSVESPDELRALSSIASGLGTRAQVVLRRLVPAFPPLSEARIFGDFLLDKFGMTDDALRACLSMRTSLPGVELVGLHAFRGSNIHDVDTLVSHFSETVDLARRMFGEAEVPLRVVNVGGGLAIPIEVQDDELDMGLLGRRLARLEARWDASPDMNGVRIRLEPGRFLVGPAGAYLVRVLSVKAPHGETVAIVDGGINHLLRPTLFGQEHRVRLLVRADDRHRTLVSVSVAGPLTSAIDVIARAVPMPRPEPGDLVAVLDVGAYGFTEAMPYFGSRAIPAEVVVMDGRCGLARPRLESSGILERQSLVDWDG
jgi:diaminopimelate decarboxylase